MGLFDFLKVPDINNGVKEFRETEGAYLLDVRTKTEYKEGFIRGSVNIPLDEILKVEGKIKDKDAPIFIYCRSGNRAGTAVKLMKQMGYSNVKNIGGIISYRGN
ncbi:rhodanese-like domain-containing protein [Helcococcus ovis]|uniref:Rhodanese-like domain-containing protein n=1 Tax=Helcococcus ovis TaxID=72026 RepID=A0A4R9C079_9FIRM|nr:rhodanese-like domain-containing protein [Helcococcus ovis]TFF63743.1 rhodanese-like domain-containing protein [Helcococcus ovis]TFF65051.1 rhodanese-like domain-containing protein [Helcococcus ovis]TFF66823.1 rhodanese-like domain-containing protein [Helcococcus ovis]WNZ01049.1 rhodanese-like domain-containing protein [Helcococcus ovis]